MGRGAPPPDMNIRLKLINHVHINPVSGQILAPNSSCLSTDESSEDDIWSQIIKIIIINFIYYYLLSVRNFSYEANWEHYEIKRYIRTAIESNIYDQKEKNKIK